MSVDTKVTDLIINTGLTQQELNEKYAQGVIGDNELSIVDTTEDVIQVDEMPIASDSNIGSIVQYVGTDTNDYKNGFFYESVVSGVNRTATITQTSGSSLSYITIDVNTFVQQEQPQGDETVEFDYYDEPNSFNVVQTQGMTVTCTDNGDAWYQFIIDTWGGNSGRTGRIECNDDPNNLLYWVTDLDGQPLTLELSAEYFQQQWNIVISGAPTDPTAYATFELVEGSKGWKKNNEAWVNIMDYGIAYSGTPVAEDVLTVNYSQSNVYEWKQKDVQPSRGGIEWASSLDLPQGYSYNSCRAMLKLGNLPDGRYEFYTSVKMYGDADTGKVFINFIARLKMDLHRDDYSCISIQPDLGDGWINANTRSLLYGVSFNPCLYQNNGELFLRMSSSGLFATDIGQYFPSYTAEDAKDCFRVSKIKNLATGEEYDALFMIDSSTDMSDLRSYAYISPIMTEKWYHTQESQEPIFTSGLPGYIYQYASHTSSNITQNNAVVSLRAPNGTFVARIQFKQNNKFAVTVEEETGILVGTKVGTVNNYVGIAVKVPATAYGVRLQSYWGVGAFDDSLGQYLNYWSLEDWMTFNEIGTLNPGALITEDNLGNIVQYTGATDASYTNGYFYKANGTLVVTPGSVDATCTNYQQVTVSLDIDGFRTAYEAIWGVQGDEWWTNALNNWGYVFQFNVDSLQVYWPPMGWLPSEFTSYFTFSDLIPGSVYTISTANYVQQSRSIQNQSWDRVDVQPAGTTYVAGTGIDITNNIVSVDNTVLVNNQTGSDSVNIKGSINNETNSVAVGSGAVITNNQGVAVGWGSQAGYDCTAVGARSLAYDDYSTAIGFGATVPSGVAYAIQLGNGTNNTSGTMAVGLSADGSSWTNYELLSSNGTIPEARLADTTNAQQGDVLTLDSNGNAVWQASSGGNIPTLTWYTVSTAGNTLTIADTSSAQLVKVYKNGLLLQPTDDYTISGTTLTTVTALVVGDKITTEVF